MAKGDTFFLRARIDVAAASTAYNSAEIDISAYTDPARGRVLVVDRGFVSVNGDGPAPLVEADVGTSAGSRALMMQASTETETGLSAMGSDNALFMENYLYAATDGTSFTMIDFVSSMNPIQYTGGFIVPTDKIHVGAATNGSESFAGALKVNYLFEVHTEKLSLARIQELLVSLTAN
jgi:hypothetical protein